MRRIATLLAFGLSSVACTYMARGPEDYKHDTRAVLETRNADIKACYDAELKKNKDLSGKVIVHFSVEPETGVIKEAMVLPESSAPPALGTCIVDALSGLVLDPPDEREGDATFVWEFDKG